MKRYPEGFENPRQTGRSSRQIETMLRRVNDGARCIFVQPYSGDYWIRLARDIAEKSQVDLVVDPVNRALRQKDGAGYLVFAVPEDMRMPAVERFKGVEFAEIDWDHSI